MLLVHNDIVCAIDQGHLVALVLLDLSSAFDTVDHTTLLSILQSRFSVTEQSLARFRSYLTDRTRVNHPVKSNPSNTTCIRYSPGLPPWSNVVHQLQWRHNSHFVHTFRAKSSVCRWYPILRSLSSSSNSISHNPTLHHVLPPCKLICFSSTAAQCSQNRVHLVWHTSQSG